MLATTSVELINSLYQTLLKTLAQSDIDSQYLLQSSENFAYHVYCYSYQAYFFADNPHFTTSTPWHYLECFRKNLSSFLFAHPSIDDKNKQNIHSFFTRPHPIITELNGLVIQSHADTYQHERIQILQCLYDGLNQQFCGGMTTPDNDDNTRVNSFSHHGSQGDACVITYFTSQTSTPPWYHTMPKTSHLEVQLPDSWQYLAIILQRLYRANSTIKFNAKKWQRWLASLRKLIEQEQFTMILLLADKAWNAFIQAIAITHYYRSLKFFTHAIPNLLTSFQSFAREGRHTTANADWESFNTSTAKAKVKEYAKLDLKGIKNALLQQEIPVNDRTIETFKQQWQSFDLEQRLQQKFASAKAYSALLFPDLLLAERDAQAEKMVMFRLTTLSRWRFKAGTNTLACDNVSWNWFEKGCSPFPYQYLEGPIRAVMILEALTQTDVSALSYQGSHSQLTDEMAQKWFQNQEPAQTKTESKIRTSLQQSSKFVLASTEVLIEQLGHRLSAYLFPFPNFDISSLMNLLQPSLTIQLCQQLRTSYNCACQSPSPPASRENTVSPHASSQPSTPDPLAAQPSPDSFFTRITRTRSASALSKMTPAHTANCQQATEKMIHERLLPIRNLLRIFVYANKDIPLHSSSTIPASLMSAVLNFLSMQD